MVTQEGPKKEEMDQAFTFTLVGKGWDKKAKETSVSGQHSIPPNKTVVLKVCIFVILFNVLRYIH